jgi:hypothetical protein
MNVRERLALLLAAVALVAVAGCTQPSAPAASNQAAPSQGGVPAATNQPAASQAPTPPGRGDY